ncbi:hypothetical protein F3Y22_tig00002841pilonHSYRG00191 [Hibiscus syriacus]|uniref:Uncharacterized protein n=1 Tax=Hibiscus syriacus TaxID=106335 RepID=A0A6A3CNH8_HIBSY|nr:hypothetical protein F3Y22_tig00002841pilonHSYRG00191 [Hibiscus syriacus]
METPPAEELLRKIQELEVGQAHLEQEISHYTSPQRRRFPGNSAAATAVAWKTGSGSFRHSSPLQRESRSYDNRKYGGGGGAGNTGNMGPAAVNFTNSQYLNILQSMGQSVHIFDLGGRIIYWNRTAEKLYGYSAAEALGQVAIELLVDPSDFAMANNMVSSCYDGDSRPFQVAFSAERPPEVGSSISWSKSAVSAKLGIDPQQPLQAAIASKITNLASKVSNKVKSKMRTGDNCVDLEGEVEIVAILIMRSGDESEGKPAIQKIMTLMGKKGISWPWKGNDREGPEARTARFAWPWLGSWSSVNVNSTSSASSSAVNRVDMDTDCLDYEILWEDLTIGEQIGQGSCGTVYHALWYGSVCLLLFVPSLFGGRCCRQGIFKAPALTILPFYLKVSLMKRLRHPKFCCSWSRDVTSRLCIVTEFLPRFNLNFLYPGTHLTFTQHVFSLRDMGVCSLLQRNTTKLDWRRRIQMALDVVCDFGLSRLKHETYLTTKTGKGTYHAFCSLMDGTEVLRNELSDEKSDIYSFGVLLWELGHGEDTLGKSTDAGDWSRRVHEPSAGDSKEVDPRWAL